MKLEDKTVLITGASGGIGLSLVNEFLNYKVDLILTDINPQKMSSLFEKKKNAHSIKIAKMDLKSYESIELGLQELEEDIKEIDILINTAGRFTGGLLENQDIIGFYNSIQVNLVGQVHLINRILPFMLQKDEGMIVNNASVNGIINFPCATTYTAAKTGLVAFSEALRRELEGTSVHILTLITPAIDTPEFHQAKQIYQKYIDVSKWTATSSQEWAGKVIDAIKKNKSHLYPDGRMKILLFVARHFPFFYDLYCRKVFSRYGTRVNT